VLANLIGNALQRGGGTPDEVRAHGRDAAVVFEIHNGDSQIP
jgi:hypothetical protein